MSRESLDEIAERTVGHVGADLASVCREAAFNSIRRNLEDGEIEGGVIEDRERFRAVYGNPKPLTKEPHDRPL